MITKNDIDNYFTNNEILIRSIINKSKSKFDKDVIFSNVYLNSIRYVDQMGDLNHLLVFIKRYVYQLYYWFKSRPLELSEDLILSAHSNSTIVSDMFSLDDTNFMNEDDDSEQNDERLLDTNNIYNINEVINILTTNFTKTLNSYDKILFENWLENDKTSRKDLLKFYNQNYKYGAIIQNELFKIIENYKKYIKNNYVQN